MRIAINGFGRIGRTFFRQAFSAKGGSASGGGIEIVAVNDLTDAHILAYLLRYDSVYGKYEKAVDVSEEDGKKYIFVEGKKVLSLTEKEPENLPWKDLDIDVVVESTGFFASEEGGQKHIKSGAKYVIISAPAKGNVPHVLIGTNTQDLNKGKIISNASCTTNCVGPVAAVMSENPGIEKAMLTTVHAYTATQALVDSPQKDPDRSRAAALNIIPTSTGAAEATAKAVPALTGLFTGVAIRVPVPAGSIIDFTFVAKRDVTAEEINGILEKASREEQWQGILEVTYEPLVSSDILGTTAAAIVDLNYTRVVGGNLVKVLAWYDNEWAYSAMMLRGVIEIGNLLK